MRSYISNRPDAVFDIECYPNYFAIGFRSCVDGRVKRFVRTAEVELDVPGVMRILRSHRIIGFNSQNYDIPMLSIALRGATNRELKTANDAIIVRNLKPWEFSEQFDVGVPAYVDHVDLMEVSPGSPSRPSLKLYAGRLHSEKMQDLPYDPDEDLTPEMQAEVFDYLGNDLRVTHELRDELLPQIKLREILSDQYGVDVRSKSDAQAAEAIFKREIKRLTGSWPDKPTGHKQTFKFDPAPYLSFQTKEMQVVLERFASANFVAYAHQKIELPAGLEGVNVVIGGRLYNIGVGGLHSTEKSVCHVGTDEEEIVDRDVTSYYPSMIINTGEYPKHLGPIFRQIYITILKERVAAKRKGDKNTAETLKILLNGVFGKTGNWYSIFLALKLMIQTTVGGQLALLMLIERLTLAGFEVLSANTDGIVTAVPKSRRGMFDSIIIDWELDTGLDTEETRYRNLCSRDVNNYFAIDTEGNVKAKGVFVSSGPGQKAAMGMKKNPNMDICAEAVIAYVKDGTPISETIRECDDINKFVCIQKVEKPGAEFEGEPIGKAVRFYYSSTSASSIKRISNGATVSNTTGARPLMQLPKTFPEDLDYHRYEVEAYALLQDIGHPDATDPSLRDKKGAFYGRLPAQKTIHIVDPKTGVTLCGKERDSIRKQWVQYDEPQAGFPMCRKCERA